MHELIKRSTDCRILIVDDEATVLELLRIALGARYQITTCLTGTEACGLLEMNDFDVVVTDLRLPDMSGLDILNSAKSKDAYTEVIIITGYASLDSATVAINMGASSYIEKPMSLADFQVQVEKAVASRLFHLRSLTLMRNSSEMAPEFKDHLADITSLYYFTRKLTLSLEISEIMRITIEEAIRKTGALLCVIAVKVMGFNELYAMPASGAVDDHLVKELLLNYWDATLFFIDKKRFQDGKIPCLMYHGIQGSPPSLEGAEPLVIPMMVTGSSIGSMVIFHKGDSFSTRDQEPFLYIISSIVSSLIHHGYMVLQARQLAKTDSLTGIANHRSFQEALDREIGRANRRKITFTLIFMDIDNFKQINDSYGHLVGDTVIKDLVVRVNDNIRSVDVFARYGGEEFALILPETDLSGAEVLAQRIRTAVNAKPIVLTQHTISYTISIGIALYDGSEPTRKDQFIDKADKAMYVSKRNGKNRVTISETNNAR